MIMGIITLIISLFLNNYILNYLPYNIGNLSLFTPMFFIVALVLIYPYFKDYNKYYLISFLYGLMYDLINTDTLFLNACIFLFIAFLIRLLKQFFVNNLLNNLIIVTILIIAFDTTIFISLSILSYINYDITYLTYKITHSLLLNSLYTVILYYTLNFISNRYHIKKFD